MRNIYMTDGSVEGFFTAVFDAYLDPDGYIASTTGAFQTAFGDNFITVPPSEEKSARVFNKLKEVDRHSLSEIDYALRTSEADREQVAFLYIRRLMKHRAPVRGMLTAWEVRRMRDLCDRVGAEIHQLSGFLRFQETATGIFYAPCAPDNDVVDLLMPHFTARFKNTPFVIHDLSRQIAGMYNGEEWLVSPVSSAEVVLSEAEENFSRLWKKYYHTVYIPARKNTRQMKGYMPVRYWKFMSEKVNEEIDFPEEI
jgi:probable DNA metabolism protein